MPKIFRVVDLFAGCGGLTEGLRKTERYTPVGAVEIDPAAAATYAENFGSEHIRPRGIAEWLDEGHVPDADVVVGGPPCQGFSNLGKRLDDDPRNELWREYWRALTMIKPMVFVVENVDRFLRSHQYQQMRAAAGSGALRDYELREDVVVAAAFGSSQVRRRAIVIGTHRDLKPIDIPVSRLNRENWRTVAEALAGVPHAVPRDQQKLPPGSVTYFGKSMPGPFTSRSLHITRHYEGISLERFKEIPAGGNRFNLPDRLKSPCWLKHTTGAMDVMGRLRWNRPSVTIRTEFFKPEKGRYLHPSEDRALTHYEAARLQGFDDEFKWCGNKLQIARQIGNAVPVELAMAIGQHVADALDEQI
ncbi:DNA cytosine methyltransferase [Micromonospora sp. WMMD967]|uniref:DNA cytosine methyltransferase n=1 Tax=Micromonospora sp. WMMD967 TaxID=3016101 RepID=UPI002415F3B8|nr:DNA cytosine methyltransferase [Micromonospora sp. WMMD967]MDG4836935.1 DNA cytosine methyltransferase [Micromonospora sp. WMMD967]